MQTLRINLFWGLLQAINYPIKQVAFESFRKLYAQSKLVWGSKLTGGVDRTKHRTLLIQPQNDPKIGLCRQKSARREGDIIPMVIVPCIN